MKNYLFCILFAISCAAFAFEKAMASNPGAAIPRWEDGVMEENTFWQPNLTDWSALRRAFAGDPLAFVNDSRKRMELEEATAAYGDRKEEKQKELALAAYFATIGKADISFCMGNLDVLVAKMLEGKSSAADHLVAYDLLSVSVYENGILPRTWEDAISWKRKCDADGAYLYKLLTAKLKYVNWEEFFGKTVMSLAYLVGLLAAAWGVYYVGGKIPKIFEFLCRYVFTKDNYFKNSLLICAVIIAICMIFICCKICL